MKVILHIKPDDGMSGDEINLEFAMRGDLALLFQRGEHVVGLLGDIGIEEIVECHVGDGRAWTQPIARAAPDARVQTKRAARWLEGAVVAEQWLKPCDPVQAIPRLAIRNPEQVRTERRTDGFENLARVPQGYAADKVDVTRAHL